MEVIEDILKLQDMRPNIVQSIRALRVADLEEAASREGHVFWRTSLRDVASKADAAARITADFELPPQSAKGLADLSASITGALPRSAGTGFVIVLEHMPLGTKDGFALSEEILDVFRDAAEHHADRRRPLRCFFSAA